MNDTDTPKLQRRTSIAAPPLRKRGAPSEPADTSASAIVIKKRRPRGRPTGSRNKRTIAAQQIAAAKEVEDSLILPVAVMLRVMRILYEQGMNAVALVKSKGKSGRYVQKKYIDNEKLLKACDIAAKAAPYVHPRLSSIEVIKSLSDDDLDQIIAAASAQAGVSISFSGEGTPTAITLSARAGAASAAGSTEAAATDADSVRSALVAPDAGGQSLPGLDAPASIQDFLRRQG